MKHQIVKKKEAQYFYSSMVKYFLNRLLILFDIFYILRDFLILLNLYCKSSPSRGKTSRPYWDSKQLNKTEVYQSLLKVILVTSEIEERSWIIVSDTLKDERTRKFSISLNINKKNQ